MITKELIYIIVMVLGVIISMIAAYPMRRHLLKNTAIKKIGTFQVPFYLKDYNKLIADTENTSEKRKYRSYFIVYMLSNLVFILAALAMFMLPGTTRI